MREYSTPAAVEIPSSATLTDVVFERAARSPAAVVMRTKGGTVLATAPLSGGDGSWRDVTAREFADDVTALAKGLIAAGIAAGDRVALMSRTRYEWTAVDYAIWAAGATTVPIYETSSAEQVEWILTDSGARALVVETPAHLETATHPLSAAPEVSRVWLIEGADQAVPGGPVPAEPLGALVTG